MTGFSLFQDREKKVDRDRGPACNCGQRFAEKVLCVLDDAFSDPEDDGDAEDRSDTD